MENVNENAQQLLSQIDGARPERDDGPEPPKSVEQAGIRQGGPTRNQKSEQQEAGQVGEGREEGRGRGLQEPVHGRADDAGGAADGSPGKDKYNFSI